MSDINEPIKPICKHGHSIFPVKNLRLDFCYPCLEELKNIQFSDDAAKPAKNPDFY